MERNTINVNTEKKEGKIFVQIITYQFDTGIWVYILCSVLLQGEIRLSKHTIGSLLLVKG